MKPWEAERERRMLERANGWVKEQREDELLESMRSGRWEADRVANAERLAKEGR